MYVGCLVYHREADGNEHYGDKIGDEGVGCHLLKVASEFLCNHCCCRSTRTDNTCENGFGKRQTVTRKLERHNHSYHCRHRQYLKHANPQMPYYWPQLMEVDLAERHEQHQEHERRQHSIEHRFGCQCESVECRHECKN